jgi:hypothetical protein
MVLKNFLCTTLFAGLVTFLSASTTSGQTDPVEEESAEPTPEDIRELAFAEGGMLAGVDACEMSEPHRLFANEMSARFLRSLRIKPVLEPGEIESEFARGKSTAATKLVGADACKAIDLDDTYVALIDREASVLALIGGVSPSLPVRTTQEVDEPDAPTEMPLSAAKCPFNDKFYEHGTVLCIGDLDHKCRDGKWGPLGTRDTCR